jgi:hypothetical protein
VAENGFNQEEAESLLKGVSARPGEAVSFITGLEAVENVRAKYAKKLGKKFVPAQFHAMLLQAGNVPPAELEKEVAGCTKKPNARPNKRVCFDISNRCNENPRLSRGFFIVSSSAAPSILLADVRHTAIAILCARGKAGIYGVPIRQRTRLGAAARAARLAGSGGNRAAAPHGGGGSQHAHTAVPYV